VTGRASGPRGQCSAALQGHRLPKAGPESAEVASHGQWQRCDAGTRACGVGLHRMSRHHPMRMSPGASALWLRICVMLPGLRRRACWRSAADTAPASLPRFPAESCRRCPRARPLTVRPQLCGTRRDTGGRANHTDRPTAAHSVRGEAGTNDEEPAACPPRAREATVTQQAVTVLVPEHPAPASEKPAEPGAGRDEATAEVNDAIHGVGRPAVAAV
jgi:hypothetical protein